MTFFQGRAGYHIRYKMGARRIEKEQGWIPIETYALGLRKTVSWNIINKNGFNVHKTPLIGAIYWTLEFHPSWQLVLRQ